MEASEALALFQSASKQKIPSNHARILLYLKMHPGSYQKPISIDCEMSPAVLSSCMQILIARGTVLQVGNHKDKKHTLGAKGEIIVEKLLNPKPNEPN